MHIASNASKPILKLLPGLLLAGIAALSLHILLQQIVGLPYPDVGGVPIWARLLRPAGECGAVVAFWWLAQRSMASWHPALRVLTVGLVYAMAKETLRTSIMSGVVTDAYAYHLLRFIPALVSCLVIAAVAGLSLWLPRRWWLLVPVGILLAVIQAYAVGPAIAATLGAWINSIPTIGNVAAYDIHNGPHVLVPAYLTYIEPVIGACALCALTWQSCGSSLASRLAVFGVLWVFLTGHFVPLAVWSFFGERPWHVAFASMAQFTLEHLVLALGVALAWHLSDAKSCLPSSPPSSVE